MKQLGRHLRKDFYFQEQDFKLGFKPSQIFECGKMPSNNAIVPCHEHLARLPLFFRFKAGGPGQVVLQLFASDLSAENCCSFNNLDQSFRYK